VSTYISTISACSERDDVLALVDVFPRWLHGIGFCMPSAVRTSPFSHQSVD